MNTSKYETQMHAPSITREKYATTSFLTLFMKTQTYCTDRNPVGDYNDENKCEEYSALKNANE